MFLTVKQLHDEIERLKGEISYFQANNAALKEQLAKLEAELEQCCTGESLAFAEMRKQLAAAQKDAEPWKPLNTAPFNTPLIFFCVKFGVYDSTREVAEAGRGDSKWKPIAWKHRPTSTQVKAEIDAAVEKEDK